MTKIAIPLDGPVTDSWSQEERGALIANLADALADHARTRPLVDTGTVLAVCERLRFLAIASNAFLDNNKSQILNG